MTLIDQTHTIHKGRVPADDSLEMEVRRFGRELDGALHEVAESARSETVRRAIEQGSADSVVAAIDLDPMYNVLGAQQDRIAGEHLRQALVAAGTMTPVEAVMHFDIIEPLAVNYAAQRAGFLIRDVQQQVRDTVNGLVVDALQGDYTYATLADQIERVIPLTSRQAATVENVYAKTFDRLIGQGKPAARAEVLARQAADRAAAQALARRAEGIARTELMTASNAGRFSGFSAGIGNGVYSDQSRKEWITGGDPCDDCDPLDGEIVGWDESFSIGLLTPPVHPNCRCVVAFLPPAREEDRREETDGPVEPAEDGAPFERPESFTPVSFDDVPKAGGGEETARALREYSGVRYEEMNGLLREGPDPLIARNFISEAQVAPYMERIELIQQELLSHSAPTDMIVYRSQGLGGLAGIDLDNAAGTVWRSDSFLSTSTDAAFRDVTIPTDVRMEILVPEGSPGAGIAGKIAGESEWLAPYGTEYQIMGTERKEDGTWLMTMIQVPR